MFDLYTYVALFHATLKYDFDIDHVSLLPTAETRGWREQGGKDRGAFPGSPGLEAQSSAVEESKWRAEPLNSVVPG